MTALPSQTDYTALDRDALERRIDSLIDSAFPTWSEKQRANFGNILKGQVPFVGDIVIRYLERASRESAITTALLRKNLLARVKLIDYHPELAAAATATVALTLLGGAIGNNVSIPAGTILRTKRITTPVRFQVVTAATLVAGQTSINVNVEHSETHTQAYTSTGRPGQRVQLLSVPFLSIVSISATNGAYTEVDNFLDSDSTERHYTIFVDENDRANITWGDGVNGAVPVGTVTITYKTGGGYDGNVEAGAIDAVDSTLVDALGNRVQMSAANAADASGGRPRQSNAEIRDEAPRSLHVLERCIAREDFEVAAETISGVSRALHLTSNETDSVPENEGYLYVVPTGGGAASAQLLEEVAELFEYEGDRPSFQNYLLRTYSATYQTIDHTVRAYRASGYTNAQMKAAIDEVLADFYSPQLAASRVLELAPRVAALVGITELDGTGLVRNPLVDFGFYYKDSDGEPANELAWSTVYNVIRDLDEVRKLDADDGLLLDGERLDVQLEVHKFPALGTVTVIDGNTGQEIT